MIREIKIGIAILGLLLGIFVFVLYKRFSEADLSTGQGEQLATAGDKEPRDPKPTIVATNDGDVGGSRLWNSSPSASEEQSENEPTRPRVPFVAQNLVPAAGDRYADPSASADDQAVEVQAVESSVASDPFSRRALPAEPRESNLDATEPEPATLNPTDATELEPSSDSIPEASDLIEEPATQPTPNPLRREDEPTPIGNRRTAATEPSTTNASTTGDRYRQADVATDVSAAPARPTDRYADIATDPTASETESPAADAIETRTPFNQPRAVESTRPLGPQRDLAAQRDQDSLRNFDPPQNTTAPAAAPRAMRSALVQSNAAARGEGVRPASAVVENGLYTIQPNDSYYVISEKVYGTGGYFKAVYEHNKAKFANPDKLPVGQQLSVPSAAELARRYPELCPKDRKAPAGRRIAIQTSANQPIGTRNYVVAEGDTLFDIARYELGKASRWAEIYDLNREVLGDDFDFLRPGTELALPAKPRAAESFTRQPSGTTTR